MTPAARARIGIGEDVDETSERWVPAIHEAAHAVLAEELGARVRSCRVTGEHTGNTRHTASAADHAVIAVGGERATRLLCSKGGGSTTDYEQQRQHSPARATTSRGPRAAPTP